MPSVSEPFGIAPLEALLNDVPILISKQSGLAETFRHALKVDFWDTLEMANKIVAVLRHKVLAQSLLANGQAEARRFRWEDSAAKVNDIYQRVLNVA
jgi:glycosyltransferase involved in cell wall biosynthesis